MDRVSTPKPTAENSRFGAQTLVTVAVAALVTVVLVAQQQFLDRGWPAREPCALLRTSAAAAPLVNATLHFAPTAGVDISDDLTKTIMAMLIMGSVAQAAAWVSVAASPRDDESRLVYKLLAFASLLVGLLVLYSAYDGPVATSWQIGDPAAIPLGGNVTAIGQCGARSSCTGVCADFRPMSCLPYGCEAVATFDGPRTQCCLAFDASSCEAPPTLAFDVTGVVAAIALAAVTLLDAVFVLRR